MAKVSFVQIPLGQELLFKKVLCSGDRFTFSRIRQNRYFTTRKSRKGMTARSLLPTISQAWAQLTQAEKIAWATAGADRQLDGYKTFTKDKTLRIKNDIAGNATPTILHQDLIGGIHIESPATGIKIAQLHPQQYFVSMPVPKHKGMRKPVLVIENFDLPLTLQISYQSNLTACGADPYAKFYAVVVSQYQGTDIESIVQINFALSREWNREEATLNGVLGKVKSYALFIEAHNVRGDLFFDNVSANHSAQNWARDNFCDDIDQAFSQKFFQVPEHWVAVDISAGASFASVYNE